MPWLEVETKIKVHNPKEMRKRIKAISKFVKKERRGDDYFALKKKSYPKKAFRIRNTKEEHVVNFKKHLKKYWSDDIVVKQEFEFNLKTVEYVRDFLALLRDLGFKEWMKKIKTSESYRYKKDKRVVVELNYVKHLGYFIELEYLCQMNELKKAKKKLRQVMRELGINKKDIDNTGYTKMLFKKGIKDRKYFLKEYGI